MATVNAGMTMSLDGFVTDEHGSVSSLWPDLAELQGTGYMDAAVQETGAVVMGRRAFEMGDPDAFVGNYEFQVPIFVITHSPPAVAPKQDEHLTVVLGGGLRLLENIDTERFRLEKLGVEEVGARTSLGFRVLKQ